ncbi:outer membrane protein [Xanthomonas oryzae pv. oryzae KACC 10331]|uniref:Outer membrane protein n=1 Tax=Xanthomonas oryzae pv. oryzae (strain KACC10331 / KXO85) TaxID=291331 RepID=Q5H3L6_XANOR|nr:outer membrane protein [Xanthomonas oryzae pv. oryzae KACC 10331]BAE67849.1 conserved hypothetical protein [Xanthomonas oryzae pv. oryzae MAFF 311018]
MSPKSNSGTFGGTQAEIQGAPALSCTYEYFLRNNLGLEVHAAVAGKHDLELQGLGKVGSYWSVPPSVLLQYHINGYGTVLPFVGVGINYTTFLGEDTEPTFGNGDLRFRACRGGRPLQRAQRPARGCALDRLAQQRRLQRCAAGQGANRSTDLRRVVPGALLILLCY